MQLCRGSCKKRGSYAPALVHLERKKQRATSATSNSPDDTSTLNRVPQSAVEVNTILLKRTWLMRLLIIWITNQPKVGPGVCS